VPYGSYIEQLASSNTPTKKSLLQRQIDTTDAQIDALVNEFYGLTSEKISLVGGRRGLLLTLQVV